MKECNKKSVSLQDLAVMTVLILTTVILCFLNWIAMSRTYSADFGLPIPERVGVSEELIVLHLILVLLCGVMIYILSGILMRKNAAERLRKLSILASGGIMLFSLIWICQHDTLTVADQAYVHQGAVSLALEDGSFLKDSYFWYYPHQYSMVVLFSLAVSVFGRSLAVIQVANILSTGCFVWFGSKLVQRIFQSEQISAVFLFLCMSCFPLVFYSPFIYGDIISTGMIMMMMSCAVEYKYTGKTKDAFLLALAALTALMARKNSLIALIAVFLVFTVLAFDKKIRSRCLVIDGLMVLVTLLVLKGVPFYVEQKIQAPLSEGVPPAAFVTMGLSDSALGPGWYNGYVAEIPSRFGFDEEQIGIQAKEELKEKIHEMVQDPSGSMDFFARKIGSEWADPSFQSLSMNNYFGPDQFAMPYAVYHEEKIYRNLLSIMNVMQSCVYLCALASTVLMIIKDRKKPDLLLRLLPMVLFLGGFLFHLGWEAKGRYCFPYYLMLFPYAAYGLTQTISAFLKWLEEEKIKEY